MTERPLNNRSLLEEIRDVVVILTSVSVFAVCIAVVVVFVLFSPLLHSVDNIESATESLAGVAEGLTTLSEDASAEIISISDGFDTITVNVETATQDIAELADDLADIAGRSAN
jgi:hypothetical protein